MRYQDAQTAVQLLILDGAIGARITTHEGLTCVSWEQEPGQLHIGFDLTAVQAWIADRDRLQPLVDEALGRGEKEIHIAGDGRQ